MHIQKVKKKAAQAASNQKSSAPNWGDHNIDLRRRYLVCEHKLTKILNGSNPAGVRNIRRVPRLKAELADIGQEFVQLNRGLSISIARKFNRHSTEDQDNFSAALLALWEAFTRFDPERGTPFSTFAHQHIAGSVQRTVRQTEYQHLSQTEFNLRNHIRLAQNQLTARFGRIATFEELAQYTGLPLDKVVRVLANPSISLDAPVSVDNDITGSLLDVLSITKADDEFVLDYEDALEPFLQSLSDLELWMLLQRSGFLGVQGLSLVESANGIGIGREVARRAETHARVRLAATALADRLGRVATPEEVATALNIDVKLVVRYLATSWADMRDRLARCANALSAASYRPDRLLAEDRLSRCGEEFMALSRGLVSETAGRYLTPDGELVGLPTAALQVWEAFVAWNSREGTFPMFLRTRLAVNFRRARATVTVSVPQAECLWDMVRDCRVPA